MRQLPGVIMTVVFVVAFLVLGGVIVDFLSDAASDVLGANYQNSTTSVVVGSVKTLYQSVLGIIPLPILIGLIGIAIASLWFLGGGRSAAA
ncbi:MAG: hypothetical protein QXX68_03545 [Candidatus Pacearchaeota archaeon]